jgi:hypothetical protein
VQNLSALQREALSRGDSSPDRAGGGAHAPSEEFAAELYPGLNPLSVPAGDVLIRAVVPVIAELGSGRGEAAGRGRLRPQDPRAGVSSCDRGNGSSPPSRTGRGTGPRYRSLASEEFLPNPEPLKTQYFRSLICTCNVLKGQTLKTHSPGLQYAAPPGSIAETYSTSRTPAQYTSSTPTRTNNGEQ